MTVPSETNRSGPYNGNGSTTVFDYQFRIVDEDHLKVIKTSALGVETILTIDTDYVVSDVGEAAGGQVACTVAPAVGETITILRNIPFVQETDLENQGAYYAETVEDALDLAAMRDQQLSEEVGRSLKIPGSFGGDADLDLPAPEGLKFIAWNEAGDGLRNADATELVSIAAYGTARADIFDGDGVATEFELSTSPAALNNLDVSVGGVTQLPGDDYTWTSGTTLTFTTAPADGVKVLIRYMQALPQGGVMAGDVEGLGAAIDDETTTRRASILSAAEYRSLQVLADRRFDFRDMLGYDLAGNNDNAAELQAALNESASSGDPLHMPKGRPALGAKINVPRGAVIQGYLKDGQHDTEVSAFHVAHSGIGFEFLTAGGARAMRDVTIWRDQPASTGGWAPNDNGFDIRIVGAQDIDLTGVHLANATRGIEITGNLMDSIPSGRINLEVTGRPFLIGLQADYVMDCIYADLIHFWPFINDTNMNAYVLANGIAMQLGRVDNAKIGRAFAYGYRDTLRITQNAASGGLPGGSTAKLHIDVLGADYTRQGIIIDGSASNPTIVCDYFYATGNFDTPSTDKLIDNLGTNSVLHIKRCDVEGAAGTAIRNGGTNGQTIIDTLYMNRWDMASSGAYGIDTGVSCKTVIGNRLRDYVFNQPANVYTGAGLTVTDDWRSYTPTISAQAGAITSATIQNAKYRIQNGVVDVEAKFTITNNGTGAGDVRMTLPYGAPIADAGGWGRELAVNGQALAVTVASGASVAQITDDDNAYPGATNAQIRVSFRYLI